MPKLSSANIIDIVFNNEVFLEEEFITKLSSLYNDSNEDKAYRYDAFLKKKLWRRMGKVRLHSDNDYGEFADYIKIDTSKSAKPQFVTDVVSFQNDELVEKYYSQPESIQNKCVLRIFDNSHQLLVDSFRLEVVTTPADDQIIGWVVFVD